MAEIRHLLSDESTLVLRAVQARSDSLESVEMMTRTELYDHLALRGQMGASEEEVVGKVQRWKDARDVNRIMGKAAKIARTNEREASRLKLLEGAEA